MPYDITPEFLIGTMNQEFQPCEESQVIAVMNMPKLWIE
jgi:hypothetical protein